MRKSTSGFTIVELLIVIVVIAILATISIVAYNGIQLRARNSQTISAVAAYVKALQMYKVDKGQFPPATSCLGDRYESTNCSVDTYAVDGGGLNSVHLAQYLGSSVPMPSPKQGRYNSSTTQLGGAIYVWNNTAYGGASNGGIGLYHQGSGDCPAINGLALVSSPSYADGSGLWCRYSMN